jgi:hypothetical protein
MSVVGAALKRSKYSGWSVRWDVTAPDGTACRTTSRSGPHLLADACHEIQAYLAALGRGRRL